MKWQNAGFNGRLQPYHYKRCARLTSTSMNKFMTLFIILMIIHLNSFNVQAQTENPDEQEEEEDSGFKCYNCSSYSQPDCDELGWGQTKYLHSCLANSCSLVEMEHPKKLGVAIRVRRCGVLLACDHVEYPVCCSCQSDGCNRGNICSRAHYSLVETMEKTAFCLLLTIIISVYHDYNIAFL
ncbi:hypothetical protein GQX74_009285 [Glossina fuscipes]|nr:hypothetical protein GQX74_009285 [Glossina fuscipes]